MIYIRQILKDRYGYFYFRCRKCKLSSVHYYDEVSAILVKERHSCKQQKMVEVPAYFSRVKGRF